MEQTPKVILAKKKSTYYDFNGHNDIIFSVYIVFGTIKSHIIIADFNAQSCVPQATLECEIT